MELNNRELAGLIWLALFAGWAVSQRKVRSGLRDIGLRDIGKSLCHPTILFPLIAMIGYVVGLTRIGSRLGLWNSNLLKGTVVWFIGSAPVLLFNLNKCWEEPRFFRPTALRTLELTVFLAFFMNLFVFSLPTELILQPLVGILLMVSLVAERVRGHQVVKKLVDRLLAIGGFAVATFIVVEVVRNWPQLSTQELLLDLALPVWLTTGLLPFLYLAALYAGYESAFMRINLIVDNRKDRRRAKLALVMVTLGRVRLLNGFGGNWAKEAGSANSIGGARREIKKFLVSRRQREAEIQEEKDRQERYAGVAGVDHEGRQLDRLEFEETVADLRWLATCQMGWYRNRGSRYRADMLETMNHDFTSHGLPKEHGITLQVSKDGQSWWAWRHTVTGWCFAIGAAGPPPDQWEYDGPEPPQGFPGKDESWGPRPLSMSANRNW